MEVTLKKGTLFINDDITIEFEEAFLKMSNIASYAINPLLNPLLGVPFKEEKKVFKVSKPVKVKLPKVKAIPVSHPSGVQNYTRPEIEEIVFDFMKGNKETVMKDLIAHVRSIHPDMTHKYLSNILTKHKGKGTVRAIKFGVYGLTSKKVEPVTKKEPAVKKTILPKVENSTAAAPTVEFSADSITHLETPYEVIAEEKENDETFFHYYPSGDGIILGDNIRVLTSEAVTEDDILTFDPDLTDKFGIVMKCEEGSNMIKIKTNREDREVLVYPHWIKLVNRK